MKRKLFAVLYILSGQIKVENINSNNGLCGTKKENDRMTYEE